MAGALRHIVLVVVIVFIISLCRPYLKKAPAKEFSPAHLSLLHPFPASLATTVMPQMNMEIFWNVFKRTLLPET
jgi:hypothetical protein